MVMIGGIEALVVVISGGDESLVVVVVVVSCSGDAVMVMTGGIEVREVVVVAVVVEVNFPGSSGVDSGDDGSGVEVL